jgi:hypothetical protein
MADENVPNPASQKDKAEGERLQETERLQNDTPEQVTDRYDEGKEGGGITNRPVDEEIDNQQALPRRGRTKSEEGER